MSYAFGYAGDCQIQLIQQHDDQRSIYLDMYEHGQGGGLHFVATLVSAAGAVDRDAGVTVSPSGAGSVRSADLVTGSVGT